MNFQVRKALVIGIVVSFIGISLKSSLSGNFIKKNNSDYTLSQTDNYRWIEFNDGLINGLISWSIVGVVVDHQNPSTVYALTRSRGLYKSEDGGASWTEKNEGLPDSHIVSMGHTHGNLLTRDPNDPEILYANFNGQVYKYTTVGSHKQWININNGIDVCDSHGVAGILVDPQDSNHIFAAHIVSGCNGGIFESFDADLNADLTWTQIASSTGSGVMENDAWTLAIDPTDNATLFSAPPYLGFLYSTDGGHYWYRDTPLGEGRKAGNIVVVHPDVTNRIILGHPTGIHVGVYTIEGEGLVWTWTNLTDSVTGYIWDIDIARSDSNMVYAVSSDGLFKSNNGGLNWSEVGSHEDLFLKSIAIDPTNPDIIYLGSGNGMFKSSDEGHNLTDITNEIAPEMEVRATAIAPSDPNTYYCNLYGVGFYRSSDRGRTWIGKSSESGITRTITILVDNENPDVVYAGLERIYKSVDGGSEWVVWLDPERNEQFCDLEMDSQGNIFATSVYTVAADERYAEFYRSTDDGHTWEGPNESFHHQSICVGPIVVDPADTLYVASYDFLRKSMDNGQTWIKLTNGLTGGPDDKWIDGLAVDPIEPNRLYLATRSHKIFASADYGNNWAHLPVASPGYPGRIVIDHLNHGIFYVFGLYGWYKYVDFAANYEEMSIEGIDAPYTNFRSSALQDPLDANRFITGDLFQGFLVFTDAAVADFSAYPTGDDKPLEVTFTDRSTGSISNWSWDFGDGEGSTDQNASHTYTDAGAFTVSLTVTGPAGEDTEVKENYIHVSEPSCECELVPDVTPTIIQKGETLGFQATVNSNADLTGWVAFATHLTLPGGSRYPASGWINGPFWVNLNPYGSASGPLSLFIPSYAPLGTYTYNGTVGLLGPPPQVFDTCQFQFEVIE